MSEVCLHATFVIQWHKWLLNYTSISSTTNLKLKYFSVAIWKSKSNIDAVEISPCYDNTAKTLKNSKLLYPVLTFTVSKVLF